MLRELDEDEAWHTEMTDETIDAIFVMDYSNRGGGHRWSNLPDDLWWRLVSSVGILNVDGIGFQNVQRPDELPKHLASKLRPEPERTASYQPYHADSNSEIAVFGLTDDAQDFLLSQHFDQWNRANEQLPFDEVCLFQRHMIFVQAVPYENVLLFYSLSRNDIHTLFTIDARFRSGLYHRDVHERVSL